MLTIATLSSAAASDPRNVYLDVGANWANTLRLYRDVVMHFQLKPHAAAWEIYAFEASPYIQPYVEAFVDHLNSDEPEPCLTVPPAGSTWTLAEYAYHFGCCAGSNGSKSWEAYSQRGGGKHCSFHCCDTKPPAGTSPGFAECMYELFETSINTLSGATTLNSSALVAARVREAARPPTLLGNKNERYTFVPAAAGSTTGTLELQGVTRHQMLHGGGSSKHHPRMTASEDIRMRVQLADVAGLIAEHFREDDLVVLKLDAEGAEFGILRKLIREDAIKLVDVLLIECHTWADKDPKHACQVLEREMLAANPQLRIFKETKYSHFSLLGRGYDSLSTPLHRLPVDPRRPLPAHCSYLAGFDAGFRAARSASADVQFPPTRVPQIR